MVMVIDLKYHTIYASIGAYFTKRDWQVLERTKGLGSTQAAGTRQWLGISSSFYSFFIWLESQVLWGEKPLDRPSCSCPVSNVQKLLEPLIKRWPKICKRGEPREGEREKERG